MELRCQSFYFYSNGIYQTKSKWNNMLQCYETDVKEYSTAIRIFGTIEEIDETLNEYCKQSGLNLDEAYDFTDKDKLKEYKKHYKNKGLIINLR
jgi:lipoprotein NlpI